MLDIKVYRARLHEIQLLPKFEQIDRVRRVAILAQLAAIPHLHGRIFTGSEWPAAYVFQANQTTNTESVYQAAKRILDTSLFDIHEVWYVQFVLTSPVDDAHVRATIDNYLTARNITVLDWNSTHTTLNIRTTIGPSEELFRTVRSALQ